MALLKILQYPDERLHTVAARVAEVTDEIRALVDDMAETMYSAPGIGLAATQVDVHQRIIIIDVSDTRNLLHVLINPEITARSGESDDEEGCLSVPGVFGKVQRAGRVTGPRPGIVTATRSYSTPTVCWQFAFNTKWIIWQARYLSSTGRE